MKEVRNNVAIYSHALPRIHVTGGQRSVRIAHGAREQGNPVSTHM